MSKIFILLMVFISSLATPVGAHANAADMVILLNDICMNTDADLSSVEKIVIGRGGINMPKESKIYGAALSGFLLDYAKKTYLIEVAKEGSCSIISMDKINSKQIVEILQKNYFLSEPTTGFSDATGDKISTIWKVISRPQWKVTSPPQSGAILLRVGKKESESGVDANVVLTFITARMLNGIIGR
ncbi:hypothetical protein [Verminephrobacter aporrectodeae]|uniref:hypothetical protein n=1 Tax=Verminephrobacter aporrectodeae TaxID=1110389 RepID=UPI0022373717|nr:hypothetical protein [Verminephrobacter aporrectodeae]